MMRAARALSPSAFRRLRWLVLGSTALLAFMRGISFLPAAQPDTGADLSYIEVWLPLTAWAWVWVGAAVGLVAAIRYPVLAVPTLAVFVFLTLLWGTSYLASWWLLNQPETVMAGATHLLVAIYAAVLTTLVERPSRRKE